MKFSKLLSRYVLSATLIGAFLVPMAASQQANSSAEVQRTAMQKLSFLAGHWSGPVTIVRGPGEPLRLTQTEDVQLKLGGLVMLVQGMSTDASGKVLFSALATIAYDDASHTYRFRAYNEGHYVDTELSTPDKGFSWSMNAGPAHIVNTMHLTDKGEWSESTEVSFGGGPAHQSMNMLLQRQP